MAAPSVTYTFVNGAGNVIDANQVNQNFSDLVAAFVAGTSDISVDSIKANTATVSGVISTDSLIVSGSTINIAAINSQVSSGIAAYDYSSIVQNEMSYSTGTFTAIISGITNGSGADMQVTARYSKIGDVVTLIIPSHRGGTDQTGIFPDQTPVLNYSICNFPAEITPTSGMVIDMPMGAYDNGSGTFDKDLFGEFGYVAGENSALSHLNIENTVDGYWNAAGTGVKGYNKNITIVYKLT